MMTALLLGHPALEVPVEAQPTASAAQGWNPEGVYQWRVELIYGLEGTLTVFKRADGSWSAHGTMGGTGGEVLLGKSVEVGSNWVRATLLSSDGDLQIKIQNKATGIDGTVTLVEAGLELDAKVTRVAD
jgi:hypothetical protein